MWLSVGSLIGIMLSRDCEDGADCAICATDVVDGSVTGNASGVI